MLLYIDLEDYLGEWFIHEMGGEYPVKLKKGSMEWTMLELYLTTPPEGFFPVDGGQLAIQLPNFRSKDTRYNFYLPPRAAEALKALIKGRFDLAMWNHIHKFSALYQRQDNLIYAFMEKHGIECNDKNWNAIAKRYQRKRDLYLRTVRRKKNK